MRGTFHTRQSGAEIIVLSVSNTDGRVQTPALNYEGNLRNMRKKSKYQDANSDLSGKSQNIGMKTQNYEENVKISG